MALTVAAAVAQATTVAIMAYMADCDTVQPVHLDLDRARGLTVHWHDGQVSFFPIAYLRRMSPSADQRHLREEMAKNPLTVLPPSAAKNTGEPLSATGAEMVGNYAIRITFSDGHDTGIFSWQYLRQIDQSEQRDGVNGQKPPERSERKSRKGAAGELER